MNLSGSKGQPERETKAKSERATEEKVCVCVRHQTGRICAGGKTGLVSPVA